MGSSFKSFVTTGWRHWSLNMGTAGNGRFRAPTLRMATIWEFPKKIGVPYLGVLLTRILLFRVIYYYIRVPYFRKLPYYTVEGPGILAGLQAIDLWPSLTHKVPSSGSGGPEKVNAKGTQILTLNTRTRAPVVPGYSLLFHQADLFVPTLIVRCFFCLGCCVEIEFCWLNHQLLLKLVKTSTLMEPLQNPIEP